MVIKMEFVESELTSKFQLTLPKKVRLALGIEKRTPVVFLIEDKNVKVIQKPADLMKAMEAMVSKTKTLDILEKLKKSRQEW